MSDIVTRPTCTVCECRAEQLLKIKIHSESFHYSTTTRMHYSRMHTVRCSSCLLGEGSAPMHAGIHPPPCEQKDRCENITWTVITSAVLRDCWH